MMKQIGIVFRKEVRDNLRDRRALYSAIFFPLLGPILIAVMFTVIGKVQADQEEKTLDLPIQGVQHAPGLVTFLKQHDIAIKPAPDDPEAAVRSGNLDVVLIIPENYGEDLRKGLPATVQVVLDKSRQSASVSRRRVQDMLYSYGSSIGRLRLLARGISPNVGDALAIESIDVSTPQSRAAGILNAMLPYFIIFACFMGGLYITIDTTTGERERGSLEPLLMNPAKRSDFVLGKLGATLIFTIFAVVESLLAFMVVLRFISLENLGLRIVSLSPSTILAIFLITIPIMLLAVSLQMIIASYTRSFKEAQTYLSLLPIVPALPSLMLSFLPVKTKLWMMLVPTFGQQLLINKLMRGEPLETIHVTVSAAATLCVGLILTYVVAKLYERETVVFGR
ncbi:MAG: ABC transporter permease [Desulfobacterales bacterium]